MLLYKTQFLGFPTANLPTIEISIRDWRIEELTLADPMFNKPGPIYIVIGGEALWRVQSKKMICIGADKPFLMNNKIG